jgi:hypothetical protein
MTDGGGAYLMFQFWLKSGGATGEALPEHEAEVASLSRLNGKEVWHDVMASVRGEATMLRGKGGDDTNLTGLKNEENPRGWFS